MVYFLHCFGCCFLPVRASYNSDCDSIFARDRYILIPFGPRNFFVGTERAHSAAGTHPYLGPRIIVFVAVSGGDGDIASCLVGPYSYRNCCRRFGWNKFLQLLLLLDGSRVGA